jgi:hypothetical protein
MGIEDLTDRVLIEMYSSREEENNHERQFLSIRPQCPQRVNDYAA